MSSWWDTSGFSNLASQALKNAQKRIDKVLDIDDNVGNKANKKRGSRSGQKSTEEGPKGNPAAEGDFWSAWMSPKSTDSEKESESQAAESQASASSSWSLPWGITSPATSKNEKHGSEKKLDDVKETELVSPSREGSTSPRNTAVSEDQEDSQELIKGMDSAVLHDDSKTTETLSEIQQSISTLEISTCVPDDKVVSPLDENSEKFKESETVDNSEITGFIDSSYMEVSSVSADSAGWDISDSVMKLVESKELSSAATPPEKIVDKTDSFLHGEIESKEISGEIHDEVSNQEEMYVPEGDDKSGLRSQIVCDESKDTDTRSEDSNAEQTLVSEQKGNQDHYLCQNFSESENKIPCEITQPAEISKPNAREGEIEERSIVRETSHVVTTPSSRCEIEKRNDEAPSAEGSKEQSDLIHDYIKIPSDDSTMEVTSDFAQPVLDAEISRSNSDLDTHIGNTSSTGSSETSRLDSSADTIVEKGYTEGKSEEQKDRPYSLFSDGKITEEESTAQADLTKSISPASSYVKCMIEEAMEESGKEDSGSDNHSNESKSESSKIDSELEKSVYSGHESSDDIETTTSSDIEIISAPLTRSSEKQFHPSYDLPTLKINLQPRLAGAEGKGHHRSDSQSSSSTQSKGGDHESLSPERGEGNRWADEELQHPDLESVQEEGTDNPYHPERLLKLAKIVLEQQISGGKKLAEMAEVLQARETKLVQMSKDNHQLMEDNSILRNQLQQSEEAREVETADLKALTDEFTVRIGESEKKLQTILREKESLKGQLASLQTEMDKRSQGSDLEALLEEKTEQVTELMAEGEKLSKQQLQSSNIIKKLRAKEKETDASLTSQKKKIEEITKELDRLKVVLDSKEEMETKQSEAITQLNAAVQRQERDNSKALSDLEDAQEKNRGLQTALDNAYKEIAELHRSHASQDSKAQETALSVETSVREELKMVMEREQMRFKQEREAFIMQADDLRLDMARLEKEHERREDLLREEIAHLQERLQQDEARSQDLSQSVTSATRPLLRQIENLQATFGAQSKAWEKVEKSLTDRLAEAQTALALAQEKERTASENYMDISAKLASYEMTNTRLKQEKANLIAQKEANQSQLEDLQDAKNNLEAHLETTKKTLNHEIGQLKIEKVQLDSQFNLEKNKLEAEKKKCAALEEQISLAEKERPRSRGTPSPSPSMSVSRQESLVGSFHEFNTFGMKWPYDDGVDSGSGIMGSSKTSVYESLRQSGATVVVENLQSQLKLREGEIAQLQSEIAQLERTRESMARELVNLTNQNEELQETKVAFKNLEEQFQELNNRYSAILLMYGEKEEQVQELRLDLQDVKEMYKTQIDALLAK